MSEAKMEEAIFSRPIRFQTENVSAYNEPEGAGRDSANAGKFHLHLELLFDTPDEAKRWMKQNDIPLTIFER